MSENDWMWAFVILNPIISLVLVLLFTRRKDNFHYSYRYCYDNDEVEYKASTYPGLRELMENNPTVMDRN